MTRVVLQSLLAFAMPFLCYGLFILLTRRGRRLLDDAPWFWLSVAGLVCVVASVVTLILLGNYGLDGVYVPPHMDEQGRIVPGTVRPGDGT